MYSSSSSSLSGSASSCTTDTHAHAHAQEGGGSETEAGGRWRSRGGRRRLQRGGGNGCRHARTHLLRLLLLLQQLLVRLSLFLLHTPLGVCARQAGWGVARARACEQPSSEGPAGQGRSQRARAHSRAVRACSPSITVLSMSQNLETLVSRRAASRAAAAVRCALALSCAACAGVGGQHAGGGGGGAGRSIKRRRLVPSASAAAAAAGEPRRGARPVTHHGCSALGKQLGVNLRGLLALDRDETLSTLPQRPPALEAQCQQRFLEPLSPWGGWEGGGRGGGAARRMSVTAHGQPRSAPAAAAASAPAATAAAVASPSISSSSTESKASRSNAPDAASLLGAPPSPRSSHPATSPASHFCPNSSSSCGIGGGRGVGVAGVAVQHRRRGTCVGGAARALTPPPQHTIPPWPPPPPPPHVPWPAAWPAATAAACARKRTAGTPAAA